MIHFHYIPSQLIESLVVPIPKGRLLDRSNPSYYWGISVSSVLSKLLEKVLLESIDPNINPSLHNLQGGFRQNFGTSHTSFLVREAIHVCQQSKEKCYIASLDAQKAFDTVWHNGLLVKLSDYGINGDLWLLILYWYRHLSSRVRWKGVLSRPFNILQRVKQGALLSPIFTAFILMTYWFS